MVLSFMKPEHCTSLKNPEFWNYKFTHFMQGIGFPLEKLVSYNLSYFIFNVIPCLKIRYVTQCITKVIKCITLFHKKLLADKPISLWKVNCQKQPDLLLEDWIRVNSCQIQKFDYGLQYRNQLNFMLHFMLSAVLLTETAAISSYEMDDNTTTSSAYHFEWLHVRRKLDLRST